MPDGLDAGTAATKAASWQSSHSVLRLAQWTALCVVLGVVGLSSHSFFGPATEASPRRQWHKVAALWNDHEFECMGFRATSGCSADGPRVPSLDLPCNSSIALGMSGYCEVRNRTSGDVFHVMETACNSVDDRTSFTCNDAKAFTEYPIQSARYVHPAPLPFGGQPRGIVFSIYDSLVPGVYAIVHLLRSPAYNCTLPIELFYEPHKFDAPNHAVLRDLVARDGAISLRTIDDPNYGHFRTKTYAVYHSSFDQVLLLDCDNLPLRDPTYLFDLLNETTTAVFWPDYWQPSYSIFNIHEKSLLWEYLGMAFTGGFEQESGQVLVDRRASHAALHKLMFYTTGPAPADASLNLLDALRLLHGDKDLFRLAWINTSTPFHFIREPPAIAGIYRPWLLKLCGLAMIQHDADGAMAFLHRNMAKINSDPHQVPLLTDLAKFDTMANNATERYAVECKGVYLGRICWGFSWFFVPHQVTPIAKTDWIHVVEAQVIKLAIESEHPGWTPHRVDSQEDLPSAWLQLDVLLGLGTFAVVAWFACRWRRRGPRTGLP